jgi:glycosyltransferase involved in cell wall biosynthesis
MLTIRKKRENTEKNGLLLLGTAGNKVTLDGMTAFIEFWKSSRNKNKKEKLLVAGYWTKELLKAKGGDNVELLGTISNEQLDDILCQTKAMICYQEYGSGALTKIREMLIAGVPVLANHHAARSYHGHNGVVEFSGFADIDRAAAQVEKLQVPLPRDINVEMLNRELIEKIIPMKSFDQTFLKVWPPAGAADKAEGKPAGKDNG